MASYVRKGLFVLVILLALIQVVRWPVRQASAGATATTKTLDRNLEPVVVSGASLSGLIGAPVEHLRVYTYTGSGWGGQIPAQVDEVDSGSYVATEDGLFDSDDEIVVAAGDLGDQAPSTASLRTMLPISATWYEIRVTDPVSPAKTGWAYLVRSSVLTPTFTGDYVDYITGTRRIVSSRYHLGFAGTHAGLDYLSLYDSGVDILDRSKLRLNLDNVPIFGTLTLTEDDLADPTDPTLIKDGPIRVLLEQEMLRGAPGLYEAALDTMVQAYDSWVRTTTSLSLNVGGGVTISSTRISVDMDSVVSGATFYNAFTPAGVVIDGSPDLITETLSTWAQFSHSSGRVIQVSDPTPLGGTPKTYYRDNSTPEPNDTGQPGSYGDSGFLVEDGDQLFTADSILVILPPAGGENVGDTYLQYVENPLTVTAVARTGISVYLPAVFKALSTY